MDTLKQSIILFDLDGTLTDSEEGIIRSTQYMQEKMGQRIWSAEELHFIVGPPLMQSFTKEFGIEGAHAIGIPCIAVEYGYGDRDEFKAHGADYIAKTTEDVEKLF